MSVRRTRPMVMVIVMTVLLALVPLTVSTHAVAEDRSCDLSGEARQPVLLVHGYNSGPSAWNDATRQRIANVAGVCVDVFGYKDWSTHWVTDEHIGAALASRIRELATASSAAGGSGRVIVVAHSMGGLATRCAVNKTCNGGLVGVADDVRELITLGTPNTGTYLRGKGGATAVFGGLASLLSGSCYLSFNGANPICEQVRALGTSTAAKAFTPGSDQLRALPAMPARVPVFAVAGHVEATTSLFGWQNLDVGNAGDLIVKQDSALDEGRRYGKLGGVHTIECGKINILRVSGQNCWHGTETNDDRFVSAVVKQIESAKQVARTRARPTTTAPIPRTSAPTRTIQPSRSYSPGSSFDDTCYNAAPFAPSYTSSSIQMTMSCAHVPQTRFFLTQVVYGDPNLQVTPSTGNMHVVGTVIDIARSSYGYRVLQVQASSITF